MPASLDDLLSMAVFARVVAERSFTAAAPLLGLSKSVVSERVSALEERLGTRLLHRTTRKLSLTPEGEQLYQRARTLLAAADDAADAASAVGTRVAGRLRVTLPIGLGLARITAWLPEFSRAYPDVSLELSLTERMVDVVAESFDIGVRMAAQLADSTLMVRRVGTDPRLVVASPDYLARHPAPRHPEDLVEHACLRLAGVADDWSFSSRSSRASGASGASGASRASGSRRSSHSSGPARPARRIRVTGPLVTDNVLALRIATLEGMGLSVLLRSLIEDDLAAGTLVPVLPDHEISSVGIFLVSPHRDVVPAKVRAFLDFLAAKLQGSTMPPAPAKRTAHRARRVAH
jgi:DNA-binding transcriptional LysR family regulator